MREACALPFSVSSADFWAFREPWGGDDRSRLSSLALGTGDRDCVYHFALPKLQQAVAAEGNEDSQESLKILVEGKRFRDISDLPLDLAV